MTDNTPPEASVLELLWLEAVSLIKDQHSALVERVTDQKDELARSLSLKRLGQDLVACAAAAELIIRRRGERKRA